METKFNFSDNSEQPDIKKNATGLFKGVLIFLKSILSFHNDVDKNSTVNSIKADISMKGTTAWILICSILIASVGLNANSTPVVIGAMLISPLLGPILGLGFSIATNDIETLKILHSAEKNSVSLENSINSSIHTAYELEDCLLSLDEKRSIKILRQIKQNDPNSLALVIWALDKLISTSLMAKKSASPKKYLENAKMWNSKISLYLSFIRKMESSLSSLSKDIFEIEKTFKGNKRLDAWKEVERVIIRICAS